MTERKTRIWNPDFSPEQKRKIQALKAEIPLRVSALKTMREALKLSQAELAELLNTTQSNVSKMESKPDVRLDKLRQIVEARGGRLHVVAKFPDLELELPV